LVWKNSPAEKAGVKNGDLLIDINGISGFKATISEIKHLFETPSKRPLRLTLFRDNKVIHLKVPVKSAL
jgi:C-terminal processing protease CtpA/Prc